MTAPALAPPVAELALSVRRLGAAPRLDVAIAALWARISARHDATCPLCHGEMEPEYGAGALPVAGLCRDCGTVLT